MDSSVDFPGNFLDSSIFTRGKPAVYSRIARKRIADPAEIIPPRNRFLFNKSSVMQVPISIINHDELASI